MQDWNKYSANLPLGGRYASWLYGEYAAVNQANDDNVGRTALQMAIWNVLYDADFTVDTGDFRVSQQDTAVRAVANSYLTALLANQPLAAAADATWLQLQDCSVSPCRDAQDFIGPAAAQSAPVPEPASLSLLAVGLAGVGFGRWRGKRAPVC